jgi:curli production assembly/transport component CsgG|tara:strand:+ start:1084 stop:1905 length:822 start_codon:yes stop_codon:yes gene_type:complete
VIFTSSCSIVDQFEDTYSQRFSASNVVNINQLQSKALINATPPSVQPIVAVYPSSFTDQTGQRKSNSQFALFSTAVTQQPSALLIRALKHASKGKFFRVVERVGLDNLTKERQLIRSAREQLSAESKKVPPLLFAGVLLEGAVISYETNLSTGGVGARYLGIGKSAQYRQDNITVSLRMVSVATGEILVEVMSQKTLFSYGQSDDVFRFIEMGTELVEIEAGNSSNESTTIALMKAIEGAVLELINIGYDRRFWTHEKTNNTNCDDCVTPMGG